VPTLRGKTIVFNGPTNETYVSSYEPRDTAHHVHSEMLPPVDVVELEQASAGMSVRDLLALLRARLGRNVTVHLGRNVVNSLTCAPCRRTSDVLWPLDRLRGRHLPCPTCGTEREVGVFHSLEDGAAHGERTLLEHGVPPLDVLYAFDGEQGVHVELTGDLPSGGAFLGELRPPPWRTGESSLP